MCVLDARIGLKLGRHTAPSSERGLPPTALTKEPWRSLSPSCACSMGVRVLHSHAAPPGATACSLELSHQQPHCEAFDAAL